MDTFSSIMRKGKIQEVRGKILDKLYDTKGLREKTAKKLVELRDIGNVADEFISDKTQKTEHQSYSGNTEKEKPKIELDIRTKRINEAKDKRQRGYYNNPEIFSKIAQKLVDLLGI